MDKKVALITGAAGGIGRAIAIELGSAGYSLALHVRAESEASLALKSELESSDVDFKLLYADISKHDDCVRLIEEALEHFGQIDVLVNNAGITRDSLIIKMSKEDFCDVIDTNLSGAFYLCQAASKSMIRKRSGRIINITSVVGLHGNVGQSNYASAKAGLIGLTKSLAKELASRNVLVNAIAPGFIESPMTDKLDDEVREKILNEIPLKTLGRTKDVAELVGFLSDEKSSYITGQVISIDGGMSI